MDIGLSDVTGPGTGTVGLIPAPPISVAPSGIPTRPTVDVEGSGDTAIVLPVQSVDEPPESPPPSNTAPGDAALPDPGHPVMPCTGLIGEMPGVVISVDPKGMPVGRVDCGLSGDVANIPVEGCIPGTVVWARAATGNNDKNPTTSITRGCVKVSRRDRDFLALTSFDTWCSRMEVAPANSVEH
jgi:hypothetical protein